MATFDWLPFGAISHLTAGRAQPSEAETRRGSGGRRNGQLALVGAAQVPDPDPSSIAAAGRRLPRWPAWAALVALAVAFLAVPSLAGVPAHLTEGCGKWIALAVVFELLSVLGFVVVFKLVFGGHTSWGRAAPASLRALGASALLPGGGLVGPGVGARSAESEKPSLSRLARSTIAFVIVTEAPGVLVVGALGLSLWLGLASGPHAAALSLLPATLALALVTATCFLFRFSRHHPVPHGSCERSSAFGRRLAKPIDALRGGVLEAHTLLVVGNWKLSGAVAYYAFDNAVLWAAFHAFGRTPSLGVVVMGYFVGSLGAALPIPAGLGAVDGGLIGALVLYGVPAAPAAAAVLLYRGISLALPLSLGAIAWAWRPVAKWRRRATRAVPRPGARDIAHQPSS